VLLNLGEGNREVAAEWRHDGSTEMAMIADAIIATTA
jgi:hypothetical protein